MSREVEYGIRVTAKDELTAPSARMEAAAKRLESAVVNVSDGARRVKASAEAMAASLRNMGIDAATKSLGVMRTAASRVREAIVSMGASVRAAASSGLALKNLGPHFSGLGDKAQAAGKSILSLGTALKAAVAGAAIFQTVDAVLGLGEAAAKVQQIEIRTLAAIRQRQSITQDEFESLKALNAARERSLGIDADMQLQLQGTLASMGVQKQLLDEATRATIGLSNATGQGLNEASRVVAKAFAGNTAALQEYGIKVSSVEEAQAKFNDLFTIAAAQSDTYGSSIAALRHTWEGLGEAFGGQLINNAAVRESIASITAEIERLTTEVNKPEGAAKIGLFFGEAAAAAREFAELLPEILGAVTDITARLSNWLRVRRQVGLSGMIFMDDEEVEALGRELRAADRALSVQRSIERKMLEGDLLPAAGGMGGLQERMGPQAPGLRLKSGAKSSAAKTQKTEGDAAKKMRDQRRLSEEADAEMMLEITEWVVKQRNSAIESGLAKEKEARERALSEERTAAEKMTERARAIAEERARIEADARSMAERETQATADRLAQIGMQIVDSLGNAFSIVGRLQNKTVTEIVRNDQGMLEERTRITEQYIATTGDALKQFFSDVAGIVFKAALYELTATVVKGAALAIAAEIGHLGIAGIVTGAIAAGALVAAISSAKSAMPPPPKFFTGGRVPGPLGAPRVAMVEAGERVVSVADAVDRRGAGRAGVTINQQLLVAPSRVSMERANRDSILPAMRRMQRLGMAT